jgi:hypothetical protein
MPRKNKYMEENLIEDDRDSESDSDSDSEQSYNKTKIALGIGVGIAALVGGVVIDDVIQAEPGGNEPGGNDSGGNSGNDRPSHAPFVPPASHHSGEYDTDGHDNERYGPRAPQPNPDTDYHAESIRDDWDPDYSTIDQDDVTAITEDDDYNVFINFGFIGCQSCIDVLPEWDRMGANWKYETITPLHINSERVLSNQILDISGDDNFYPSFYLKFNGHWHELTAAERTKEFWESSIDAIIY